MAIQSESEWNFSVLLLGCHAMWPSSQNLSGIYPFYFNFYLFFPVSENGKVAQ